MNQEKLIQTHSPSMQSMFYSNPVVKNPPNSIEKSTVDEFLSLSRSYFGLDKNSSHMPVLSGIPYAGE